MLFNPPVKKLNKKSLSLLFFLLSFFLVFFARTTFAAGLSFSPLSGSYNVGDTIETRIVLSSSDQSANAVSATISFPKDLLTLSSISKNNSIISLWPTEPSYSNVSGTADMEGIILGGYQGKNGTILLLSFKAKAAGNATIKFTTSSILANDGLGSNILSTTDKASFNITLLKGTTPTAPAASTSVSGTGPTPTESITYPSPTNNPFFFSIMSMLSVVIPVVGLIILLILLVIWGQYHILRYREHMRKKLAETEYIVSKSFDILGEDVQEEVRVFKKIKAHQPLTDDERSFINQFKKDIEAAEKVIISKMKNSEK
jgi:hypothetical protein